MIRNIDHQLKLETQSKHKSLYEWAIQEVDEHGQSLGRDLIPWGLEQHFEIASLSVQRNYMINREYGPTNCWIYGVLSPALDHRGNRPSYSMLGTKRTIPTIEMWVKELQPDERFPDKTARADGFVSYTDSDPIWGGKTEPDYLRFNLFFLQDEFREIFDIVDKGRVSTGSISLSAEGIYSKWTPDITTDQFKVLATDERDQLLEIPTTFEASIPRLGMVSDVSLSLRQSHKLVVTSPEDEDYGKALDEENDRTPLVETSQSPAQPDTNFLKKQVDKLQTALWVIVALLLAGLVFEFS